MGESLRANILADLAYYRRSRLLLAFLLVFLVMTGLQALPPLFSDSGVQSFNTLRDIFSGLNFFLLVLAAGLGLFVISSHLRSRSLKMVFTKPCRPAVWLGSAFISAVFVTLFLNAVVLLSMVVLSLAWKVPVRMGLVFVSAETFVSSVGIIAYLMLLGTMVHPAVAATVAIIFNADLFYSAELWARATISSGTNGFFVRALAKFFHFLYVVLPMFRPFSEKTDGIHVSLRVVHGEWIYLLYTLGYGLTLAAFCYCVALLSLERKRHI